MYEGLDQDIEKKRKQAVRMKMSKKVKEERKKAEAETG
jgi:hypothetical protein